MARSRGFGRVEILVFLLCAAGLAAAGYYALRPHPQDKGNTGLAQNPGSAEPTAADARAKAESGQKESTGRSDAMPPQEAVAPEAEKAPRAVVALAALPARKPPVLTAQRAEPAPQVPAPAVAVEEAPLPEEPPAPAPVATTPDPDLDHGNRRWSIGAFYGARDLQLRQRHTLGNPKVGVLLPSYLGINSRFTYEEWEAWGLFDTYKLKYESTYASGQKRFSSLQIGVAWRMFWAGARAEDLPLFKNNGGPVDMAKQSWVFASVGTRHDWALDTETPTSLRLLTRVSLPVALSTGNTGVNATTPGGIGAGGTLELKRQLYATPSRKALYLVWPVSVDYLSLSQKIDWSPSQGPVDSRFVSISTALGIQFEF